MRRSRSASRARGRSRSGWAGRSPKRCPRRWRSSAREARLRASTWSGCASRRRSRSSCDTEVQQPALVATSLAVLAALQARGLEPDFVVGHSVGEFAALAAACVDRPRPSRSRSFASAGSRWPRRRAISNGSMAAILGLEDEVVEELCARDRRRLARELQLPRPDRRLGRARPPSTSSARRPRSAAPGGR